MTQTVHAGSATIGSNLLEIIEQGHEAEIHVELLVTMEQCEARVVSHRVHMDLLVASDHHDIFQYSRCWLSREASEFKAVTVKVDWMDVIARVTHAEAVTFAFL